MGSKRTEKFNLLSFNKRIRGYYGNMQSKASSQLKKLASDKHSTNDRLITLGTALPFKYPLTSCFSDSVFLMYKEIRFIVCNEPLNQFKKNFCYLVYRIVKETCFYFAFVIVEVPLYLQQLLPR
jgi:hypothetical protein